MYGLWVVTFEPSDLFDGDVFAAQNVNTVAGRASIHALIDQCIDAGATAVHVTPSE